jgi:hypothetical protein
MVRLNLGRTIQKKAANAGPAKHQTRQKKAR